MRFLERDWSMEVRGGVIVVELAVWEGPVRLKGGNQQKSGYSKLARKKISAHS